jgi:hypothetical protein
MKNKLMIATSSLAFTLAAILGSSFCSADVIYYNFDSGHTVVFYADQTNIMRADCPGMKILPVGRSDCNIASATIVTSIADATALIAKNLSHTVAKGKGLDPLTSEEVSLLVQGAPFVQSTLDLAKQSLTADQQNFQQIIAKFGTEPGLQAKVDANSAAIAENDQRIQANANYTVAFNGLSPIVKTYLDLVVNPTAKLELVAAKIKDTLASSISVIFAYYSPGLINSSLGSVGGFSVGDVIKVKLRASCYNCSEQQSAPIRGTTGIVSQVTHTNDGDFVQLIVNGFGGWWNIRDVEAVQNGLWN